MAFRTFDRHIRIGGEPNTGVPFIAGRVHIEAEPALAELLDKIQTHAERMMLAVFNGQATTADMLMASAVDEAGVLRRGYARQDASCR